MLEKLAEITNELDALGLHDIVAVLDGALVREAAASTGMTREAILGEANWGGYLNNGLQSAAAGAAGGAATGAIAGLATGGVLSAPGAATGAIAGGAGGFIAGAGKEALTDIIYNFKNPNDKASHMAGMLAEALQNNASLIKSISPQQAQRMAIIGKRFKQYIDQYVYNRAPKMARTNGTPRLASDGDALHTVRDMAGDVAMNEVGERGVRNYIGKQTGEGMMGYLQKGLHGAGGAAAGETAGEVAGAATGAAAAGTAAAGAAGGAALTGAGAFLAPLAGGAVAGIAGSMLASGANELIQNAAHGGPAGRVRDSVPEMIRMNAAIQAQQPANPTIQALVGQMQAYLQELQSMFAQGGQAAPQSPYPMPQEGYGQPQQYPNNNAPQYNHTTPPPGYVA